MLACVAREGPVAVIMKKRESTSSLLTILRSSATPLTVPDIAGLLDVDDGTAAMALKLLCDAGLVRWVGIGWMFVRGRECE